MRSKDRQARLDAQRKVANPAALPEAAQVQIQALAIAQQPLMPLVL